MNENKTFDKLIDQLIHDAANISADNLGQNLPEPEPVEFSEKHNLAMKKLFKQERRKIIIRKMIRNSKKVAILLLVLVLTASISIFSVQAWRVKFLNFIMNIGQTNSDIQFWNDNGSGDTYSSDDVTLGYIPEDFKFVSSQARMNGVSLLFQKDENSFALQIQPVDALLAVDTEKAEMEKIIINGKEALYSSNNNTNLLVWHDDIYSYLLSGNISKSEMVRIAEKVQK